MAVSMRCLMLSALWATGTLTESLPLTTSASSPCHKFTAFELYHQPSAASQTCNYSQFIFIKRTYWNSLISAISVLSYRPFALATTAYRNHSRATLADSLASSFAAADLQDKMETQRSKPSKGKGGRGGYGGPQPRDVQVSKALSKLLRHQAEKAGITLDGEGYAPLDKVVRLLFLPSSTYYISSNFEDRSSHGVRSSRLRCRWRTSSRSWPTTRSSVSRCAPRMAPQRTLRAWAIT